MGKLHEESARSQSDVKRAALKGRDLEERIYTIYLGDTYLIPRSKTWSEPEKRVGMRDVLESVWNMDWNSSCVFLKGKNHYFF